jgi:hypothetical protein
VIAPYHQIRAKALQHDLFKIEAAAIACFSNCLKSTRKAYIATGQIVAIA